MIGKVSVHRDVALRFHSQLDPDNTDVVARYSSLALAAGRLTWLYFSHSCCNSALDLIPTIILDSSFGL